MLCISANNNCCCGPNGRQLKQGEWLNFNCGLSKQGTVKNRMNRAGRKSRSADSFSRRTAERLDSLVEIISPKRAFQRKLYRFSYDAVDSHRLRKKRTGLGGTGDKQLTVTNLYKLREICRDMCRNNPLANGLLKIERNGVIGSGPKIQARTGDDKLNADIEAAWKEEMIDKPCDVTGRFNINQYIRKYYLSYRRDGDIFTVFANDKLQAVEGEQVGTPWGRKTTKYFEVINGIAYSKKTKRIIGYYIGKPDRFGYIRSTTYKKYTPDRVHHMFDAERFSQSRGEPVLTPAINFIDTLCDYIDAELVAAKVNACFSMFISQEYPDVPEAYAKGISDTGEDADENKLEKMEPGMILYGSPGEKASGIGQTRPGALFDPFVLRMLTLIGRPLCMPLMLITMDFSGATFMNARLAYQKVQENWQAEQDNIIKPFVSRVWRWKLQQLIETKQIKPGKSADKVFRHEVFCRRWPYVDPFKEAKADEQQLKNGTTTRTIICARQGDDFVDVSKRLAEEEKQRKESGLLDKKANMMDNLVKAIKSGVPIGEGEARAELGLSSEPPNGKVLRFDEQDLRQYHIESGIPTINEVRKVLGLPEVPWGNVPVRKQGLSPVNKEGEAKEDEGDATESESEE